MFVSSRTRPRDFAPITLPSESTFELYQRIAPVAILYGGGPRFFVSEFQASNRLLKELWRLGRKKIDVRGMISTCGALDRASVRALNCYLQHCYGQKSLAQVRCKCHRFAWYELQREIALRWVR